MRLTPTAGPRGLVAWLRAATWSARLARRGSSLALIEGAGLGVGYVCQLLFARWMGPLEYGTYAYVVGWSRTLSVLPTLGLPAASLRLVPQYLVHGNWRRLAGLVRTAWLVSLAAGAALALLGSIIIVAVARLEPVEFRHAMVAGMWIAPLLGLVNLQTSIVRGFNRIGSAFFPGVLLRPLLVLLGALVIVAGGRQLTSPALLGAVLLAVSGVIAVQFVLFRLARPAEVVGTRPEYTPRAWLSLAFPLLLLGGSSVAASQTDLLAVGALAGREDAGLYYAAARTATVMAIALVIANAVAAPQFAALYARGDRDGLQALATAVTRWAFWPSVVAALGLIVLAEPLLALFGRAFVTARLVLTILAVGQLVNTGSGPVATLLNQTGHHRANLRVDLWMLALKIALSVVGVLWFGLAGAALATATVMVAANVWRHQIVSRELGIHASILYPLARAWRRRRERPRPEGV